jgi:hypothetical protein
MVELPRRVDLRLTIPVTAPYREIAAELAVRFAEYAGATKSAAADVSKAVIEAASAPPGGRTAIDLLLSASDGDVTVTVTPSTD